MTASETAEDVDLMRATAAGREDALATLYDRHHRFCFSFAMRMLGSERDAEEAVQETFVRLWRSAGTYDPTRASVPGWILSITRNLCFDELRRRRRRGAESQDLDNASSIAGGDRTDEEAERAIVGARVRAALQDLPADQRGAIELIYFHGLSSQEAGRMLGVPSPTIRSRLRLGLLKLGATLRAEGLIAVD